MKKDWRLKIRRWDSKKMRFVCELRRVAENELDYDAKETERISSVYVYTASRCVCVYVESAVRP